MTERCRKSFSLAVLHVMLALAERAKHGYAIKQQWLVLRQVLLLAAVGIAIGIGLLVELGRGLKPCSSGWSRSTRRLSRR